MSTTESVLPTLWDGDVPQIVAEGDTARVRKSDPLTSHAAADSSNRADSQQAVLTALGVHKHLAGFELEALLTDWSGSRVRTAVSELVKQGRVRESSRGPRKTRFGRDAIVWELA